MQDNSNQKDTANSAASDSTVPDSAEAPDFHEARLIDEQGNEVEITEEMVRKAIHELDDAAYPEQDSK